MLTVNIDIQYRQINGQTGSIDHIEFTQGSVSKIYVKLSESGLKAMRSSYFDSRIFGLILKNVRLRFQ